MLVALLLAFGIGAALGLLGGGGSVLTLPMLVYVLGLRPEQAIASSLLVVGTASLTAGLLHARAGRVDARLVFVLASSGMLGSFCGGRLAAFVPARLLLAVFALTMLLTGSLLLRAPHAAARPAPRLTLATAMLLGLAIGLFAGLVGAGGGFLLVPALTLLGGLAMPRAVGTSLLVIGLQSLAGLLGHLGHVQLDGSPLAGLTVVTVLGALLGVACSGMVRPLALRRAFGVLVLLVGTILLLDQLSLLHALGLAAS